MASIPYIDKNSNLLGTPEEEEAFDPTAVAGLGLGNQGINTTPVSPTQLVPGIENITLPTTQYPEITFGQQARADGTQAYPFSEPDRQMSGIERRSGGPEDPFSIFRSGPGGGRGSVGSTRNPSIEPQAITPDTTQPSVVTTESFFGRPAASSPAEAAQRLLDAFPSSAQAQDPIRSTFTMPDGTVMMERESGERFSPTEEQLQSFTQTMQQTSQPTATGLGVGGSEGVVFGGGQAPMGVEATRARLQERFGAPTISAIQALPQGQGLGMQVDPQGRMLTPGADRSAYEAASADMQARIGGTGSYAGDSAAREARLATDQHIGPAGRVPAFSQGPVGRVPAFSQGPAGRVSAFSQGATTGADRSAYEAASADMQARIAERDLRPGETQTERDTRIAQSRTQGATTGGLKMSDAVELAGGDRDLARTMVVRSRMGMDPMTGQKEEEPFKPEQVEIGGKKYIQLAPKYFQEVKEDTPTVTGLQATLDNLKADLEAERLKPEEYDIAVRNAKDAYIQQGKKTTPSKTGQDDDAPLFPTDSNAGTNQYIMQTDGDIQLPTVTDLASYTALQVGDKYLYEGKEYTKK